MNAFATKIDNWVNQIARWSNPFHKDIFCKAPFNTLFFSMTGDVYFCLSNRIQIAGKYPQNSIKDIIEGQMVQDLRKYFTEHNGMPGCEYCKEQIDLGNYDAAFNHYSNVRSKKGEISVIEFELSNRCNLQCMMCSEQYSSIHQGNSKNVKIPYDDQFIFQIAPYLKNLKKASFRGGEPFLIPIYYKLWDKLLEQNKSVAIGITTNGTIYNSKIETYLQSRQFQINISVDTLQKESFQAIRVNGEFDQYLKNIMTFLELSKKGVCGLSICTCLMVNNWKEIPSIFSFCNENRLTIHINYVEYPLNVSIQSLLPNEIEAIISYLKDHKNINDYNITIYDSILSILKSWVNNRKPNTKTNISDIVNSILPMTISLSELHQQKQSFFNKIELYSHSQQSVDLLEKFEKLEKHFKNANDIFFLYFILDHIPEKIVIDNISHFSVENLIIESEELIEISKQKFSING